MDVRVLCRLDQAQNLLPIPDWVVRLSKDPRLSHCRADLNLDANSEYEVIIKEFRTEIGHSIQIGYSHKAFLVSSSEIGVIHPIYEEEELPELIVKSLLKFYENEAYHLERAARQIEEKAN